jgi:AcrR family transcriptional regulator
MPVRDYERFLRKTPKQSRSRAVVEAIVQAAKENLVTSGVGGVAMEKVAARAGVAIGSLYDYFQDRDGLLQALTSKVTADNFDAFRALLDGHATSSLEVTAGAIVDHMLTTYLDQRESSCAVLNAASAFRMMPLLAKTQNDFAKILGDALAKRTDVNTDPHAAAFIITHSGMGIVHTLLWLEQGAPDRETLKRGLVEQSVRYLKG